MEEHLAGMEPGVGGMEPGVRGMEPGVGGGAQDEVRDAHLQELRRGTVVLACLRLLTTADYGYRLLEHLRQAGFEVDANTLYPLLRRLEKQKLLTSLWTTEEPRPRKYYATSPRGRALVTDLLAEWARLSDALDDLDPGGGTR